MGISEKANALLEAMKVSKYGQLIDHCVNLDSEKSIEVKDVFHSIDGNEDYLIWKLALNELLSNGLIKHTSNKQVFVLA